jgi:hypothetical protein
MSSVQGERADAACVGFLRGVANKPHAAPALSPLSLPEGPGRAARGSHNIPGIADVLNAPWHPHGLAPVKNVMERVPV